MHVYIEDYHDSKNNLEKDYELTWKVVEKWLLSNEELINKIEDGITTDEELDLEIGESKKLWQEIQAFYYLFVNSTFNLIKFKYQTRHIIYMLIPILRGELNFNTDPRYLRDDATFQKICEIAKTFVHSANLKPIQEEDVLNTLLKISKLNPTDESIKSAESILSSSSINHDMTPFYRVKETIKSSVNGVALALNKHIDKAENEYINISTSFNISLPKESMIDFMNPELLTQYIEKAMDKNNNNNSYNWDEISKSIVQDLEMPKDGVITPPEKEVIIFFRYYAVQKFFNYLNRHRLKNNSASLISN